MTQPIPKQLLGVMEHWIRLLRHPQIRTQSPLHVQVMEDISLLAGLVAGRQKGPDDDEFFSSPASFDICAYLATYLA